MQLALYDLGLVDFLHAWDFQKHIAAKVEAGAIDCALVACQHYPVITLGRQAKRANILLSDAALKEKGIDVFVIERGGDVTYHGPGQITLYPILDLNHFKKDIHWYLRTLEEAVIDFLADFGVLAQRRAGLTGVWARDRKIASIGIAIKRWVSFHGVSINIKDNDLAHFTFIRPCGMDVAMTSLETELKRNIEISDIKESMFSKIKDVFEVNSALSSDKAPERAH